MFSIDERLKGLPAVKEQVVQLYQSLNQPHLAVPGRQAGPAAAFVLGLRGPSGFAVFVYLYLAESGECAVYVPSNGTVPPDRYQGEESEALGFVESMGFIMDNLNFRGRPPDEQESMIRGLPVFQREPPPAVIAGPPSGEAAVIVSEATTALAKLFSAFCLAVLFGATSCFHYVSDKDRESGELKYELAVQEMVNEPRRAYLDVEEALKLNPNHAESWHLKALLLHHAFSKPDEALPAYLKALELKQPFSEAHVNLGTLYMDQQRYDEAIAQDEIALNDVLYPAPFIAQGNMGWAFYKKGDVKQGIEHLKAAVTINSKYCLGYMQLGILYDEQKNLADACKYFGKYRDACPDQADAYRREGVCQAKAGKTEEALKSITQCIDRAKNDEMKDQCTTLKEQLAK